MIFFKNISEYFRNKLALQSQFFITIFIGLAAFSTYSCMYAFRKPFTVASFANLYLFGMDYKVVLVLAQLIGYTIAKGLGIKYVSEITNQQRQKYIIGLVSFSLISLYFFYIVPAPDNWPFMILNGLGLGMIYGLVFSYLEGRKITELLSAFLIVSFIVSSGFMKTVGTIFINNQISENLMPFMVALVFYPIFLLSVFALSLTPEPSKADIESRTQRLPMDNLERALFLKKYGFGLFVLILVYILMTVFRDIRDNFSMEIWTELGESKSSLYVQTELIIGFLIVLNIGLGYKIKNNKTAFYINHLLIILGCLLIIVSTRSYLENYISSFWWMVLIGLGIYMAYIPFNSVLFDRLLAVLKEKANVGFLFYLADFAGYLGSIFVLIFQNFSQKHNQWLSIIINMAIWMPIFSIVFVIISLFYFNEKIHSNVNIVKV